MIGSHNPDGPRPEIGKNLNQLLQWCARCNNIALNANDHFDVEGALNGHPTRFILNTGSANRLIDTQVAVKSGTGVTALAGYGAGGPVD